MGITKKPKGAYLERGRRWPSFIIVYEDGTRRKFAKHVTWDKAVFLLEEIRNRIALGSFDLADYTPNRMRCETIGRATVNYIDEIERSSLLGQMSDNSVKKYMDTLLLFNEFIGKNTILWKITKKDIEDFVLFMRTERKTQYGTYFTLTSVRSYLQALSPFLSWCVKKGYAAENAVKDYLHSNGKWDKKELPKNATAEQVKAIRDELAKEADWQLDTFNFSLWTSARAAEVMAVKKDDVMVYENDGEKRGAVRLLGKGGKERIVPFGAECAALVEKRLDALKTGELLHGAKFRTPSPKSAERYQERWEQGYIFHDVANSKSLSYAVLNARRRAGIDRKITFHSARHTYATELLGQGVPIAAISKLLGHSEIATTEIYAKLVDEALVSMMQNVKEI